MDDTIDPGRQVITVEDPDTGTTRKYRLERELGEGASGVVFLATWLPEQGSADQTRPVALKLCHKLKWKGRLQA